MRKQFWDTKKYTALPPLRENTECDFLIVGAGVLGLSLAHFLHKSGAKNIVVIDKGTAGSGATGHSAGMWVAEMETTNLPNFLKKYGAKKTRLWWDAHIQALRAMRDMVKEGPIACDFEERPLYLVGAGKEAQEFIEDDRMVRKELHQRTALLDKGDLKREVNTPYYTLGLKLHGGYSVNPLLFAQGLAQVLVKKGVRVYEHTELVSHTKSVAVTKHGTIRFKKIIHATDVGLPSTATKKFVTTIAVTKPIPVRDVRAHKLDDGDMFIDVGKRSFHYGKMLSGNRFLLGYGDREVSRVSKNTATHTPHVRELRSFLRKLMPGVKVSFEHSWSWPYGLSKTYMPVLRHKGNATYVGGAGIQAGAVVMAEYVAAELLKKEHALGVFF